MPSALYKTTQTYKKTEWNRQTSCMWGNTITSRGVINLGTKEGKAAVTYLRKSALM